MGFGRALTDGDRRLGLERAMEARRAKARLHDRIAGGELSPYEALTAPEAQSVRVGYVLESFRGYGKVRVARLLESLGISGERRVRSIGVRQRERIVALMDGR